MAVLVVFHPMVVVYEEPVLASRFGETCVGYRNAVPRWGLTIHAFTGNQDRAA